MLSWFTPSGEAHGLAFEAWHLNNQDGSLATRKLEDSAIPSDEFAIAKGRARGDGGWQIEHRNAERKIQ
jgi:hypothetical protein